MVDLWPDGIEAPNLKTPVSILREQASLLGVKTNNVIEGRVSDLKTPVSWDFGADFAYGFYIVAPLLRNYSYRLFAIAHKLEMYPLTIRLDEDIRKELVDAKQIPPGEDNKGISIADENVFLLTLGLTLKSSKTVRVIQSLLAQSKT